jgi:hypothetical protein
MTLTPDISNELRSMVREVLRDAMAQRGLVSSSAVEPVRLANDQELAGFVARLMDPAVQSRIKSGALRFTLGTSSAVPIAQTCVPLTGVITEQKLDRLGAATTLVLAPGAVLTPLARDKARRLGLKIERRS